MIWENLKGQLELCNYTITSTFTFNFIVITILKLLQRITKSTTIAIFKELIPALFSSVKLFFKMSFLTFNCPGTFLLNIFETYHANLSSDIQKYQCNTAWSSWSFCYPNYILRNSTKFNTYPDQTINIVMGSIDTVNRKVYSTVAVNFATKNVLH